ncbi:MAG: gliding motility-associated C-terminal domain-containing protein [Bacteroidales bacterium]|jgi:hypothetical protein|nr:gliding motility-associated C-terminal domain-containing protein [Bacteroidales bacterium]
MRIKKIIGILLGVLGCVAAWGQSVSPTCPNFTDLKQPWVTATTGDTDNPYGKIGVVDGRHTVITLSGTDPNTCNKLPLFPPGENRVVRLGNDNSNSEAESITYRFIVDAENPILQVNFAVVFENPIDHSISEKPNFVMKITNKDGELISDKCGEYNVHKIMELGSINEFEKCDKNKENIILWRNWTLVGFDLSRFIGQEVRVQFTTYDCSQSGHFGYAYFTAKCIPNELQLSCTGNSFRAIAPEGFVSYRWSINENTFIKGYSTFDFKEEGEIECEVESALGCTFSLYGAVGKTSSNGGIFNETICLSQKYDKHGFDIPPYDKPGVYSESKTILNSANCQSTTTRLTLTVKELCERYITDSICVGEPYKGNGFNIPIGLPIGTHLDTLKIGNELRILTLRVNEMPKEPTIKGSTSPCVGGKALYEFSSLDSPLTNYTWELSSNTDVFPISGGSNQQISLSFTNESPCTIVVKASNRCGTQRATLPINPKKSPPIIFYDTICSGNQYIKHGFNKPIQNTPGDFVFEQTIPPTQEGCSTEKALHLTVLPPPPIVSIKASNEILCGEATTLFAIVKNNIPESLETLDSASVYFICGDYDFEWNTGSTDAAITEYPKKTTTYTLTTTYSFDKQKRCRAEKTETIFVSNGLPQSIDAAICEGKTYNDYGISAKTEGIYNGVKSKDNGCSVDISLNLTVLPSYNIPIEGETCVGKLFEKDGMNLTLYKEGEFTHTYENNTTAGCDSIVSVKIQVHSSRETTIYDTICLGQDYTKNGFTLPIQTIPGRFSYFIDNSLVAFKKVYPLATSCDSTVFLDLKVWDKEIDIYSYLDTVGKQFTKHGHDTFLTKVGVQNDTLPPSISRKTGCEKLTIININVVCRTDTTVIHDTININESYLKSSFQIPQQTEIGTVRDTLRLKNQYGCDSTVILHLEVLCFPRPNPPVVNSQLYCGNLTPLQAVGSSLIHWVSTDKKLSDWVGETYEFEQLGYTNIPAGKYEFELYDIHALSGCESERVQTFVKIAPAASAKIIGRNQFCLQAIEEPYAIETTTYDTRYVWKTSGNHYNYSKDGNSFSPTRYVDWQGAGIDTLYVQAQNYAGCEAFDTLVVYIAEYPVPFYLWNLQGTHTTIEFADSSFQAPVIAQNPDGTHIEIPLTYTMEWFFDTNANRETSVADMFVEYSNRFKPIQIHNYTYGFKQPILTITNSFGCKASYSTEIFIDIPNGIFIPNAFSPTNAAESVRKFQPIAYNLEHLHLWIYDKWGNLLWYSNEVQNGIFTGAWDGTYNGELLQSDSYIWKIDAKFKNGTTWAGQKTLLLESIGYTHFGSVMLVR